MPDRDWRGRSCVYWFSLYRQVHGIGLPLRPATSKTASLERRHASPMHQTVPTPGLPPPIPQIDVSAVTAWCPHILRTSARCTIPSDARRSVPVHRSFPRPSEQHHPPPMPEVCPGVQGFMHRCSPGPLKVATPPADLVHRSDAVACHAAREGPCIPAAGSQDRCRAVRWA